MNEKMNPSGEMHPFILPILSYTYLARPGKSVIINCSEEVWAGALHETCLHCAAPTTSQSHVTTEHVRCGYCDWGTESVT